MRSRSRRASVGDVPSVEIPTVTGPRLTIAGNKAGRVFGVVHAVDENMVLGASLLHRAVHHRIAGGSDNQEPSDDVVFLEGAFLDGDSGRAAALANSPAD